MGDTSSTVLAVGAWCWHWLCSPLLAGASSGLLDRVAIPPLYSNNKHDREMPCESGRRLRDACARGSAGGQKRRVMMAMEARAALQRAHERCMNVLVARADCCWLLADCMLIAR